MLHRLSLNLNAVYSTNRLKLLNHCHITIASSVNSIWIATAFNKVRRPPGMNNVVHLIDLKLLLTSAGF